jgi:hypothetical protein
MRQVLDIKALTRLGTGIEVGNARVIKKIENEK